ncbi:exonuclease SbcCD subunit D [Nakamurella sp. YIM 132087]|uniref:Nuclease SbcCD subunit D n=1 Tax=Nakamurella alba TaxID=2665158 RepID=A0A7K1FG16_9ACTN|nr:metallophosphoesterase [Nakamurella alba]MTD13048.1 exonuclease SbcCD subunit D [Nakamurella alba]
MRFLHTADWQLGMTRYFLAGEAQARYTAARIEGIVRIGEVARAHDCAFVLVCGDVFETNAVPPQVVRRALAAMEQIGLPVLLLPGNHDPLDASSVYSSREFLSARPANVTVLSAGSHPVSAGVEVVAAPWANKRPTEDLVARAVAELPADGTLRVVAGHGALDVLSQDRQDVRHIALAGVEAALADGRIHYLGLGDRHSLTDVGATGRVRYPGTHEVTAFDETAPGQVLVVDLSAERVQATAVRVGEWTFTEIDAVLHGAADVDALDARLAALPDKERTVVRLAPSGALTVAERARLDDLLAARGDLFASLRLREDAAVHVLLDDGDLEALGVGGYARSAAEELAELAAGDGPDAATAGAALTLLHRLTGAGR